MTRRAAAALALLALFPLGTATADVSLRWQQGRTPSATLLADYLVDSDVITDFVDLVAANFAFAEPFVIAVGAASGPDYDVATNTVRLPYAYLERAVRTQAALLIDGPGGDGEEAAAVHRALDIVEYTLYHLLGHALAGRAGIEAEERAEGYSSWAVLGHHPDGAARWREASRAFGQATRRLDGPPEDYWHAHGLHAARERAVECWIVGREPALAGGSRTPFSAAEVTACESGWARLDSESRLALDALLLPDAPLRRVPRHVDDANAADEDGDGATAPGARATTDEAS